MLWKNKCVLNVKDVKRFFLLKGKKDIQIVLLVIALLIAAAVVVAVHLLRRNTLLSIAAGTAAYMILIRL